MSRCARLYRIEMEAHAEAIRDCSTSAEALGMHMSCSSEYECSDTVHCGFFIRSFEKFLREDELLCL